jgi:hypothetical protein
MEGLRKEGRKEITQRKKKKKKKSVEKAKRWNEAGTEVPG